MMARTKTKTAVILLITSRQRNQELMFEQAFKNIDDILHKDAGCSSELDYMHKY